MGEVVFLAGQFLPAAEAKVSLFDRGYLFGDAVFDTLRTYRGKIFRLDQHLARFERSASVVGIPIPLYSAGSLAELLKEAVTRSELEDT